MESEITKKFKSTEGSLFIPYISLGDPNYEDSKRWADAIIKGGGDILELGIPFSDPVADGPVIQRAFSRAFMNPFSLEKIFATTRSIKDANPSTPLVYLTYFNPIYHMGIEKFLSAANKAGVSGFIIPDLPFDSPESHELFSKASKYAIDLIHLVTPATEKSRIHKMKKNSSGFIYYVTSFGVTGERKDFSLDLEERIQYVRKDMGLPIAAGFGISTPDQAAKISKFSDGVIIGSSIQKIIEDHGSNLEICAEKLEIYCKSIRSAMR
ncbi:tryptophan synthase subunit alpha [Leptospira sp. GIMC2001]|uniref:tryptophan synthase subunit alpha n=1 Tax=Leptospira sp. GIMC2001 TaxID=1513297 RepID=UPI00234AA63A|nr:tryptophan synthase subunit alpha [Leptospira sp. GIMC2001]WCL48727.1 tryptophan synthase subunit alpha [Leptospira sp. GIMC2001]